MTDIGPYTFQPAATGSSPELMQDWLSGRALDPRAFGWVADGSTDNGPALVKALAAMATLGVPLLIPQGASLVTDASIYGGGDPYTPPEGAQILGQGPLSVLRFKRTSFGSFYGFGIGHDNVLFRDLTIEIEVNGGSWCAVAALTDEAANLTFENVTFKGIGSRAGATGITTLFKNFERIRFVRCRFENIDYAFVKPGHDPSIQRDISAVDCTAENCTEVFEFNSPGIFDGRATVGTAVITDISPPTTYLSAGMEVKSPALPTGTLIVYVDSGTQITVSQTALSTTPLSPLTRFSVGEIRSVDIRNLRVKNMTQWAVGLANTHDFYVEVSGEDCALDLFHAEDHSSNGVAIVSGSRCNTTPGQVGAPSGANGAALIITGCRDIVVEMRGYDMTQNIIPSTPGAWSPGGVCITAGVAGTTNTEDACENITIRGTIYAKAGCTPVIAQSTRVHYDNLTVKCAPGSPASPVTSMPWTFWSGRLRVFNPGVIVHGNDQMYGGFDQLELIMEDGYDVAELDWWTTGAYPVPRNQPPLSASTIFWLSGTADPSATWQTLCPAPYSLDAQMVRKYVGSNHDYERGRLNIVDGVLDPEPTTEVDANWIVLNVGSAPHKTDQGWRIDGRKLQFRAYASPADAASIFVRFDGVLFPWCPPPP